jgi:two-component system, cell cycle response regulator DivK
MKKQKILVVEDDPLSMELVTDLLEVAGYAVLQAGNAGQGIEIARSAKPILILMDIRLPDFDGLTATGILKKDPLTEDIPVVALTASVMPGDETRALEAGCTGYIRKPIDTRAFPDAVEAFIAAQRKSQSACI